MADPKKDAKNAKVVAIAALIIALATATIAWFDGDPETKIDIGEVTDKGSEVIDAFKDDEGEDTEPEG